MDVRRGVADGHIGHGRRRGYGQIGHGRRSARITAVPWEEKGLRPGLRPMGGGGASARSAMATKQGAASADFFSPQVCLRPMGGGGASARSAMATVQLQQTFFSPHVCLPAWEEECPIFT
jgi:hypothetical protein